MEGKTITKILCLVIFGLLVTISLSLVEEQYSTVPLLESVKEEGWIPTNHSDLWDYNFSFTHSTTFNIEIENYTLYGFPIKQNIKLDVRGTQPSIHIYGGATIKRDEKVERYDDGSVRQVWTIWGMEPNETYELVFFGQGQCGRLQEAWR